MKDVPYIREFPVSFDPNTRRIKTDVEAFKKMVVKDINDGLIPIWCGVTIGSTALGSSDPIFEIG